MTEKSFSERVKLLTSRHTEFFFRQLNSSDFFLVKPLLSRKFCQKSVRENFYNFHSVVWDLAQKSFDFPKKVRFQNEREKED